MSATSPSLGVNNAFVDLSGVSSYASGNPYDALIDACENRPDRIQSRYNIHRRKRNEQQREKLLAADFAGVTVDPILQKLVDAKSNPGFLDPRNCLVFWARPPRSIRELVGIIQRKLSRVARDLWLMPLECLHMTVLEINHSLTEPVINQLVKTLEIKIPEITDLVLSHRARLVKPMLCFDDSAIALGFLPAAGEESQRGRSIADDEYTYHHLRRDVYDLSSSTGVIIASRYTVPSAHLTIGRFITGQEFSFAQRDQAVPSPEKMQAWIHTIEEINAWLQEEYWSESGHANAEGAQWIIGQEQGLDCRKGRLWYGGGETVRLGQGF